MWCQLPSLPLQQETKARPQVKKRAGVGVRQGSGVPRFPPIETSMTPNSRSPCPYWKRRGSWLGWAKTAPVTTDRAQSKCPSLTPSQPPRWSPRRWWAGSSPAGSRAATRSTTSSTGRRRQAMAPWRWEPCWPGASTPSWTTRLCSAVRSTTLPCPCPCKQRWHWVSRLWIQSPRSCVYKNHVIITKCCKIL